VIPNGVDLARSSRAPTDARSASATASATLRVRLSGHDRHGLRTRRALRAARRLRARGRDDVRFLLVGDGAVREELEAQRARGGLDAVVFTGRQPKGEMPAFLAATDACLVHLTRTELFKTVLPSKIFEAAAMRKPIVLGVEGFAAELVARPRRDLHPARERGRAARARSTARRRSRARAPARRRGLERIASRYTYDRLATNTRSCSRGCATGRSL
jgi:glycosyltransferase involved in cell wall biosynthesis